MVDLAVSVIIPTFNSARWVTLAVESALAQTLPPAQIVVVDDGSQDDTRDALEPYVRRGVHYHYQENSGVAAARNAGIAAATGELIGFLDADDMWHPRKLEMQIRVFASRPEIALLGTSIYDCEREIPSLSDDIAPEKLVHVVPRRALVIRNCFATSSVVVRRNALDALGEPPFDTHLHGPEDYDLWLRVADRSTVANVDVPLGGYRWVVGSLGKQAVTMEAGTTRILRKLDRRHAWQGAGGWLARRKAYAFQRYTCGYMYGASGANWTGAGRVMRSLAGYPLPFRSGELVMPFARLRLLGVLVLRATHLAAVETEGERQLAAGHQSSAGLQITW